MKRVETEAGAVILEIRRRGNLKNLSQGDREWLAAFAAIQMVRTRRQMVFQDDLAQTIASALRSRGVDPSQIPGFNDFNADQLRTEFLDGIPSLSRKIFPYFQEKSIVLFVSVGPALWISDHPIVRHNSLDPGNEIRGTLGVASHGVEIYLPIASKMILGFFCKGIENYYRQAKKQFSILRPPAILEEMLSAISVGEPIRAEPLNVTFYNSLQVAQSERYIFAEYSKFKLAEQMLSDNPQFRQGPKPSIVE
jgi:hypothetical protein